MNDKIKPVISSHPKYLSNFPYFTGFSAYSLVATGASFLDYTVLTKLWYCTDLLLSVFSFTAISVI